MGESRLPGPTERHGWRLCTDRRCEVVYYRGDETVRIAETRALPFHKSDDRERTVCFCFGHSVAEVQADVRQMGRSTIRDAIVAACRDGKDDCRRNNPRGRCCLSDVKVVVERARGSTVDEGGCGGTSGCADAAGASET